MNLLSPLKNLFSNNAPLQAVEEKPSSSHYHIDSNFDVVDNNSWLTDYTELFYNDGEDYWEPPVSMEGLAQLSHANAFHGSLLIARANYISGRFIGGGTLRKNLFNRAARDFIQFGQLALLKLRDGFGNVIGLYPLPVMMLRKNKDGDFWQLERDYQKKLYKKNDVIFITQYDPKQQTYGIPDYLGGMQSSLLNQDATLFRRRYYKNGAHMGFIFYTNDPKLKLEDEEMMRKAIESSKGVGNFKSMYINIPDGHKDGVQLIPVGNLATRDEFNAIKNLTAQDILVSHRFPCGKAGIIPENGSFGDPEKVGREYAKDEVIPVCEMLMDEINNDFEIRTKKHLQVNFNLSFDMQ